MSDSPSASLPELPRYRGRDPHLAPGGIHEVRLGPADTVYLVDLGDEHPGRVFGWYYGYPRCCVEWFVEFSDENRRRDTEHCNRWFAEHPGWNDPIPPAPRNFPPHHPVSGHLLCPRCEAGPRAPLPYRPARHYGWAFEPGDVSEPSDYDEDGGEVAVGHVDPLDHVSIYQDVVGERSAHDVQTAAP
jgi:hypothetical protein